MIRRRHSGYPRYSLTRDRMGTSMTGSCYSRCIPHNDHSDHRMQGIPLLRPPSDGLLLVLCI